MIPVLDNQGMRNADRDTIEGLGVPSTVLMESAAWAVTEAILERFDRVGRVVVVCGPGNNGGDGLAAARQLRGRGVEVESVLVADGDRLRGDAAAQLELAARFGVPVHVCGADGLGELPDRLDGAGLVVDALLGTGLDRPLEGRLADAVDLLNATPVPIVAVDLPSGLSGSSGEVPGRSIQATLTVTFAAPKLAHVLPPACWRCGEVAVADIGIPPWVLAEHAGLELIERFDVAAWLPRRAPDAHKGHFGHLGIVAGRAGRAGAAILAARTAVLAGAGLVTVATAEAARAAIQAAVPEAMVDLVPVGEDGGLSDCEMAPFLAKVSCLAIGPGIGTGAGATALVERLVREWSGPLVVDADGLTVLAGRLESLQGRSAPVVLTPHPGELARLLGVATAEVVADRVAAAREAARHSGAVVLAKGARSVVVDRDGGGLVNPTGTPGLASGGTGDTLTGLVGALLAQGLNGVEAAAAAAYLHGRAAELAESDFPAAVPATEVGNRVARAWAETISPENA